MKKTFAILLIVFPVLAFSQEKYTISGYIEDGNTGEKLINANIYDANTYEGTISNNYGFYSLTLNEGKKIITVSYVGYQMYQKEIELNKNIQVNISLDPNIELEEVNVYGQRAIDKVRSSQMSTVEVPMKEVRNLPVLFGEVDVLKTIQLLPGVQSGNEGTSGIYVRGGAPDQNLILLDGVPVYNVNHLFGFFSVFNADAINNINLVKGGFPARYGGRLSSVLDIRMKEGNMKEFHGAGSIGIISSKLSLEGPIIKDKTSFIVSGRRTYIDLLARPLIKAASEGNGVGGYYFYDLNGKINHKFSDRSRLYLSAYLGKDKFYTRFEEDDTYYDEFYQNEIQFDLGWGNITSALRWNYLITDKLFSNTTLTYSKYQFLTGIELVEQIRTENDFNRSHWLLEYISGINDWAGKVDFDYYPNTNHSIKFGVNNTYHTFRPGVTVFDFQTTGFQGIDTTIGNKNIYGNEISAYFEDDFRVGARIKINAGLHYSSFHVKGEHYHSFQPRFSMRYLLTEQLSLKASYAEMTQYIMLLSTSNIGLPTDLWMPATDRVKPQKSYQYALGGAFALSDMWSFSVEGYYKDMNHLIEYKEGESFFGSDKNWEEMVEIGNGNSYGGEIFIQKMLGKLTGWFGYTLSWTNRHFDNLNFGKEFPYRYDRRHDIGIAMTYQFTDEFDVGVTWVYGTGNAVTLALEKYPSIFDVENTSFGYAFDDDNVIEYYEERNGYRMEPYHRLDFGANYTKKKKWGTQTISVGVYNAYNRKNPFFLYWKNDFDFFSETTERKLMQVSLFPLIPSIKYSFEF